MRRNGSSTPVKQPLIHSPLTTPSSSYPGYLLTEYDEKRNVRLIRKRPDGRYWLMNDDGATPRGDRPYIDALDVSVDKEPAKERLWRCVAGPRKEGEPCGYAGRGPGELGW